MASEDAAASCATALTRGAWDCARAGSSAWQRHRCRCASGRIGRRPRWSRPRAASADPVMHVRSGSVGWLEHASADYQAALEGPAVRYRHGTPPPHAWCPRRARAPLSTLVPSRCVLYAFRARPASVAVPARRSDAQRPPTLPGAQHAASGAPRRAQLRGRNARTRGDHPGGHRLGARGRGRGSPRPPRSCSRGLRRPTSRSRADARATVNAWHGRSS